MALGGEASLEIDLPSGSSVLKGGSSSDPDPSRTRVLENNGQQADAAAGAMTLSGDSIVWRGDVLGVSDDLEGIGQDTEIERRIVTGVGAGGRRAQA